MTTSSDDDQPWRSRPASRGSSRTSSRASSVAASTASDDKPAATRRTSLRSRRPEPLVLDKPLPSVLNKPRRPNTALPLASSPDTPISPLLAPLPPALAPPPTSLAPLTPLALPQPARLRDWRSVPITRVIRSRSPKDAEVALAALPRVAVPP
ncbi:uncharacterized protein LOC62_06G008555 [Vanrija pseudolonga]|uniref:Uncharacterized protein n=1 Tax=Vanrija pseudolonga TaxID=143232 RepID=A0AAF0YE04_9TREE|nr:hypothetical protein LOC62_06G008555 [Vanrija pseudolonga]